MPPVPSRMPGTQMWIGLEVAFKAEIEDALETLKSASADERNALLAKHAEHQPRTLTGRQTIKPIRQRSRRVDVVGRVDHQERLR